MSCIYGVGNEPERGTYIFISARAYLLPSTSHCSMPAARALALTLMVPAVMAASLRFTGEHQGAKVNQVRMQPQ